MDMTRTRRDTHTHTHTHTGQQGEVEKQQLILSTLDTANNIQYIYIRLLRSSVVCVHVKIDVLYICIKEQDISFHQTIYLLHFEYNFIILVVLHQIAPACNPHSYRASCKNPTPVILHQGSSKNSYTSNSTQHPNLA